LTTRPVGDKARRVCPACDYIYFTDPKVGVGVMVLQDGKILLVKRAMRPNRGKWSLPAGYLDYGEDPQATAQREVLEETGLQVTITELMGVYHNAESVVHGGASIFILYRARVLGGRLQAGDDAEEAGLFGPDELPELAFDSTHDAVDLWLEQVEP
jgi:ADP-ribose pyrophosphatase YjhB (NUDIX family)